MSLQYQQCEYGDCDNHVSERRRRFCSEECYKQNRRTVTGETRQKIVELYDKQNLNVNETSQQIDGVGQRNVIRVLKEEGVYADSIAKQLEQIGSGEREAIQPPTTKRGEREKPSKASDKELRQEHTHCLIVSNLKGKRPVMHVADGETPLCYTRAKKHDFVERDLSSIPVGFREWCHYCAIEADK